MAQGKVNEYFASRKKDTSSLPSKRRKLINTSTDIVSTPTSRRLRSSKRIVPDVSNIQNTESKSNEKNKRKSCTNQVEEITAITDDHHDAPCTPTKQKRNASSGVKRGHRLKSSRINLLEEIEKETKSGYNFEEFTEDNKSKKSSSKKRLILKPTTQPREEYAKDDSVSRNYSKVKQ